MAFLWTMTLSVCLGGGTPDSKPCALNKTTAVPSATASKPVATIAGYKETIQADQLAAASADTPHRNACSAEAPVAACLARISWLTAALFTLALISWFVWAAAVEQPTASNTTALYGTCGAQFKAQHAANMDKCHLCAKCLACEASIQQML
jgi:hypothetical protein